MPFNRINGFYVGGYSELETSMSVDNENEELNRTLESHLSQLNAAIDAHEKKLKAMMIPRDVWCVYHTEAVEDADGRCLGELLYLIGLIKWQGAWRLCHGIDEYPGPPSETRWKPLADSSIPDRLRASQHIQKLRAQVIEEKKKLIPEVEGAIEALAKSLESDVN